MMSDNDLQASLQAHIQARIDTLEMRLAHQDRTVEDLNGVVAGHAAAIDQLTRRLALLADRLARAEAGLAAPRDEPPPHY